MTFVLIGVSGGRLRAMIVLTLAACACNAPATESSEDSETDTDSTRCLEKHLPDDWGDATTYAILGSPGDTDIGRRISVGDFDGDGLDDLGLSGYSSPFAYLVLGKTLATLPPSELRIGEIADYIFALETTGDNEEFDQRYSGGSAGITVATGAIFINNPLDPTFPMAYRFDWTGFGRSAAGLYRVRESADVTYVGENPAKSDATICDVDGDGVSDVILGSDYLVRGTSRAKLVNVDADSVLLHLGAKDSGCGGGEFTGLRQCGDFNEDGYDDLAVVCGDSAESTSPYVMHIVYGRPGFGDSGTVDLAAGDVRASLTAPSKQLIAVDATHESLADWDGDGNIDLLLTSSAWPSNDSEAVIFRGGDHFFPAGTVLGRDDAFVTVQMPAGNGTLGEGASIAGDMNGDGKNDLVLGSPGLSLRDPGFVGTRYCTSAQGEYDVSDYMETIYEGGRDNKQRGDGLGAPVVTTADFDGNGNSDLVVGGNHYDDLDVSPWKAQVGAVYVILR
jgi:hypothetical protein